MKTREISLVALFTALTAVGAFISIPLGPVPISLQSFFVILSGVLLGHKLGALSQILYIILGLVGLPIFAGFSGGLQSILKPSFGFIIGFVFASYVAGKISHSWKGRSFLKIWISFIIASLVIYLFGLPYMYYILNIVMGSNLSLSYLFKVGFLLFLPGDILKIIIGSIVGKKIKAVITGLLNT